MGIRGINSIRILKTQIGSAPAPVNHMGTLFNRMDIQNHNADFILTWKPGDAEAAEVIDGLRRVFERLTGLTAMKAEPARRYGGGDEKVIKYYARVPISLGKIRGRDYGIAELTLFETKRNGTPVYEFFLSPNETDKYRISAIATAEGGYRLILGYYLKNQRDAVNDDVKVRKALLRSFVEHLLELR